MSLFEERLQPAIPFSVRGLKSPPGLIPQLFWHFLLPNINLCHFRIAFKYILDCVTTLGIYS